VVRWFDLTVGCLVVAGHGAQCVSAMARPRSARVQREWERGGEVREGLRRVGGCFPSRWAAGSGTRTATARGSHAAASKAHVGHVPGRVFTPQAFPRIRGGQRFGYYGT
jgi:hypothetical protein